MKKKAYTELCAKRGKAPCKAGVMLYEDTPEGRKLLVSYNEGRFSKSGDYYVLAKGSIDEGETPLHAAIRETGEETGFDLDNFLGKQNLIKLAEGKTLHNITNPAYPGLTILEFNPSKTYAHEYHSRTGSKQSMVMYGVKVKGIDHLGALKNPQKKTTKELLDATPELPRFPVFLSWLQQGFIPGAAAEENVPLCDPEWFSNKAKEHAPNGEIRQKGDWEETRTDWQKFCVNMEHDKEAYKQLRYCFEVIKMHLKKTGLLQGDTAILKFDEKDCPLFWYVEGGHVGYAQDILAKTFKDMRANPDYARAFGGQGTHDKNLSPAETLLRGQVAAYGSFVHAGTIRAALNEALGETGKAAAALIGYGHHVRRTANSR